MCNPAASETKKRSKARCMQRNVTFHAQVWALKKNSIICFFSWRFVILETK